MKHSNNLLTMEKRNIAISLDKARDWYNRGGELKELALSAFTENEITIRALPNTWQEFCNMYPLKSTEWFINNDSHIKAVDIYGIYNTRYSQDYRNVLPSLKAAEQHRALMQLHQLRDCYRQDWLPDWKYENQIKWCIYFEKNIFVVKPIYHRSHFLSFQSEEIARKFLNNFIELIKLVGDLI